MTGNPIKTGLLSFGMSGKIFHAPFIADNPLFEFIAVVERSKKEAKEYYPSIMSYDSVEEMFANPDIELIIINTPNNTHFELSKKALESGKHVLVEKPFVPTSQEAKELFALARSLNKKVMVYQNRRWNSDFLSVKNIIESERIGNLIEMHIRFDRYRPEIGPKAFKEAPIPASGIAYDLGSHMIDQAIYLFGKPLKSLKIGTKNRENTQIEDYVCFVLSYGEGLQIYITISNLVADKDSAYVLRGTEGTFKKLRSDVQEDQLIEGMRPANPNFGVEPEGNQGILTYINRFDEKVVSRVASPTASIIDLFDEVYHTIRSNRSYSVTEDQIITQLEILEQPYWNQG
jgi:scyllo-inositol 2-dehydrogenase (NADP+)